MSVEILRSSCLLSFCNAPATTEIYPLSLHDALPIYIASTVVAVEAMDRPFVLLLGGRHKGEPYTRLAPLLAGKCRDRKSTRLNSSHANISYAVFCLKKKK